MKVIVKLCHVSNNENLKLKKKNKLNTLHIMIDRVYTIEHKK